MRIFFGWALFDDTIHRRVGWREGWKPRFWNLPGAYEIWLPPFWIAITKRKA